MSTVQESGHEAVRTALAGLAAGRPVVVVDDEQRENEGDLIFAAELATPELMAFTVRHSSGFVCVALPGEDCGRLGLPPMQGSGADRFGTAYRVTVDATGGGTGISGRDRARTARRLADAGARPGDFTRPGHVVPLAARAGGVLERPGHTEAAVDLARLAGLRPAGVLCEIVSTRDPARMAGREELAEFCARHDLAILSIAQLADYRLWHEQFVECVTTVRLPTAAGTFVARGYRSTVDDTEHLALVAGEVSGVDVPVHVHVECVPADVFGSADCDCAGRLDAAMRTISESGRGIVLYLRPGTNPVFRALRGRFGTCESADVRDSAVQILRDLGVRGIRQLYNAPSLATALDDFAAAVSREAA